MTETVTLLLEWLKREGWGWDSRLGWVSKIRGAKLVIDRVVAIVIQVEFVDSRIPDLLPT